MRGGSADCKSLNQHHQQTMKIGKCRTIKRAGKISWPAFSFGQELTAMARWGQRSAESGRPVPGRLAWIYNSAIGELILTLPSSPRQSQSCAEHSHGGR